MSRIPLGQERKSFVDGVQVVWDSTSLKAFMTCPRKYQYEMILSWSPVEGSVHLWFGSHYASALEHYFKYLHSGMTREEAIFTVVKETMEATWDYEADEPIDYDNNVKNRYTLIRSIIWYFDHFEHDEATVVMTPEGPAVEHSFLLPVEEDISFSGHLDRLVEYAGDTYVMDQKTTKTTPGAYYFSNFDLDVQMSMYTWAGQIVYNTPVAGVIIDVAQLQVGATKFSRGFTTRDKSQLNEFAENALAYVHAAQDATYKGNFPMNLTACDKFGGCPFKKVCSLPARMRQTTLEADYFQTEQWDPAAAR